jgi:hypothetical protein
MKSLIYVAIVVLAVACDRGAPAVVAAPATPSTSTAHAAVTAKPGSHEDWCGEHQVPESQCTRCNPDLVPAFKATNDWCAEHGLPESQCLKCNPNLKIVRPPSGTP